MKFGMLVQCGFLNHPGCLKKLNFQNSRWWMTAILKTVKWPYHCNSLTDFDEIWHNDTYWPPRKKLEFWKVQNSVSRDIGKVQKKQNSKVWAVGMLETHLQNSTTFEPMISWMIFSMMTHVDTSHGIRC